MHSYMRNKKQRATFDKVVELAVLEGCITTDDVVEHTRKQLLKLDETWTKVLARSANFDKSVYSSLRRLVAEGLVAHETVGRTARWTPARTQQEQRVS